MSATIPLALTPWLNSIWLVVAGSLFLLLAVLAWAHHRRRFIRTWQWRPQGRLRAMIAATVLAGIVIAASVIWEPPLLHVALTGAVWFAAFAILVWRRISWHRERRERLNRCPMCWGTGHLSVIAAKDGFGLDAVQCSKLIRTEPEPEQCDFVFSRWGQDFHKLHFPSFGVRGSGRVFWLAMMFREFVFGRYQDVDFQRFKSRFDVERLIDSAIQNSMHSSCQDFQFPQPLLFGFRDQDAWGRTNMVVNVLNHGLESFCQPTPLERHIDRFADGLFVFLDPTIPAEEQAQSLSQALNRAFRGPVSVPVAICITKTDLAGVRFPSDDLAEELAAMCDSNSDSHVSMALIDRRSELMMQFAPLIWPGFNLPAFLRPLGTAPCRLFPISVLGFHDRHEDDISKRRITPFGTAEPLLWLIHNNGYPMYKRDTV